MQNDKICAKRVEKAIKKVEDKKSRKKVLTNGGRCDRINYVATDEDGKRHLEN